MKMRHIPYLVLTSLVVATQAQANCAPPFTTMFACDIVRTDARVEFCQDISSDDVKEWRYSYNFTNGLGPAELYFETPRYYASTKYVPGGSITYNTLGSGIANGNTVYSFFVTGYATGNVEAAQIHVYENVEDFETRPESDIARLYCEPESVLIDWEGTTPG